MDGQSLYNSRSKLLLVKKGGPTPEPVQDLAGSVGLDLYRIDTKDGAWEATDTAGRSHPITAAVCGASVVLRDPDIDDADIAPLLSLWTDVGLAPPRVLATPTDTAGCAVLAALVHALEEELQTTATDAVRLDAQIAHLRDELEDMRSTIWDLREERKLSGRLPVETFSKAPNGADWPLRHGPTLSQLIPFPGHMVRAFALCFDGQLARRDSFDGVLQISLVAREDGETLGVWTLDASGLAQKDEAWAVCQIEADVPRRYRFLELQLTWRGAAEQQGTLLMADAAGDPRLALHADGQQVSDHMLALRVWTGEPFNTGRRSEGFLPAVAEEDRIEQPHLTPLPFKALNGARKISEHKVEMKWFRQEGQGLFVHPLQDAASVIALRVEMEPPVSGLRAMLSLENERAFTTDFAIVCSAMELNLEAILDLAKPDARRTDRALGRLTWTDLIGGTARPVEVSFSHPSEHVNIYLATRRGGEKVDFCHAWFRNLALEHGTHTEPLRVAASA